MDTSNATGTSSGKYSQNTTDL